MKQNQLETIQKIADLSYEPDPDTGAYVAEVGSGLLARSYAEQLVARGYAAGISRGEDMSWHVWVSPRK